MKFIINKIKQLDSHDWVGIVSMVGTFALLVLLLNGTFA